MPKPALIAIGLLLAWGGVQAQPAMPTQAELAARAARRFPQPVRVGDLLDRTVLRLVESQDRLGQVRAVLRFPDGAVRVVIAYGGVLGIGARLIAVPVEAMALLGEYMEVMEFTPAQLDRFPTYDPSNNGAGATALPTDSVIRVGLAKPSH